MQNFIARNIVREAETMKTKIIKSKENKPKAVKLDVDESKPLDPDDPLSFEHKETKEEKDQKQKIDDTTKTIIDAVNTPTNKTLSKHNETTSVIQTNKPKQDSVNDHKLTEKKTEAKTDVQAKVAATFSHLDDIKKQLDSIKTQNTATKKKIENVVPQKIEDKPVIVAKKEEKKEEKKYEEVVKKIYIPPKDAYPKKVEEVKETRVEKQTAVQAPAEKKKKGSFFSSVLAQNQSSLVAKKDKEEEVIKKLETIQKNLEELKQQNEKDSQPQLAVHTLQEQDLPSVALEKKVQEALKQEGQKKQLEANSTKMIKKKEQPLTLDPNVTTDADGKIELRIVQDFPQLKAKQNYAQK